MGDHDTAGTSTRRTGFLRRRALVVLTCALLAPSLAMLATLTQDTRYAASARLVRDASAERLVTRTGAPPATVDLRAVARRTAAQVLWRPRDVERRTAVRLLPGDQVEARAASTRRDIVVPLANALATEYVAQYRRSLRRALATARDAARERARRLQRRRARAVARRHAARLAALAASGGDARLTSRARDPEVVSRPPIARNAAFGAVVGVLVGLLLAAVLDALDRRRAPHRVPEPIEPDLLAALADDDVPTGDDDVRRDREVARFVALNLVLDGANAGEVRRHLDENFDVDGQEELVDEALRRAEG